MEEFLESLRNNHEDFDKGKLEDELKKIDPFSLFKNWLQEAITKKSIEPNAMTISTVSLEGTPSSRVVYLKELLANEFIFYTNYKSKKGQDLAKNPRISALFFWPELHRQIHIQGIVHKVTSKDSDEYFNSRPRESKIGAWASKQSEIIQNRIELEENVKAMQVHFEGREVPRPDFWGGFAIQPLYIEFWQGRPSRLHDRICFEKENVEEKEWKVFRRNP